jgi:hypothetical protein
MIFRLRSEKICKRRNCLISITRSRIGNGTELNELLYSFSEGLITKYGIKYYVKNIKIKGRKFKLGNCFISAAELSSELGYKYVEGIAISKTSGQVICHAWNIDESGTPIDVTFKDAYNYDYIGIELPFAQIFQIGKMNGGIWYCALPYLKK